MNWNGLSLVLLVAGAMSAPMVAQDAPAPGSSPILAPTTPIPVPPAPATAPSFQTSEAATPAPSRLSPPPPDADPSARYTPDNTRLTPETRLSPRPPSQLFTPEEKASGMGSGQLVGYFLGLMALAGVGLYLMKRGFQVRGVRGGENQLHLLETKMLGNRQFLVVVKYQDNKMLLGVGPGQIQYLCSLDSADADMEDLLSQNQPHPPGPGFL